jgi:hypothetical protein
VTVGNTGSSNGSSGSYSRGFNMARVTSTVTLYAPSGTNSVTLLGGSMRLPSSVASPLIFNYAAVGLNSSDSDRYPPQIFAWREDTYAMVTPNSSIYSIIGGVTYNQISLGMPAANRLIRFNFN